MSSLATDVTKRFSDRVSDYVKYRPSYPKEILEFLSKNASLSTGQTVADVGSGTGIFTKLLLDFGLKVFGVEPNDKMRIAAEKEFVSSTNFRSIKGTAEDTKLPPASIEYIFAAQAFHWFNPESTRQEWLRILKSKGLAILVWNSVKMDGSPFQVGYEDIKEKFGVDFKQVSIKYAATDDTMKNLFGKPPEKTIFENHQIFELSGLTGRLLSSSYMPKQSHPNYEPMCNALKDLFDRQQKNGFVQMEYETEVFYGSL